MNNEEPNTPKPTNPKPRPVAPFAQKKVFDVVRPGKAPASPTSRPVITGHKPPVKDDQLVQKTEGAYTTNNPFDKHGLMSHKTDLQFDTSDMEDSEEPEVAQSKPTEKPAPTSADTAKPAMSDHDPELEAALAELTGKPAPVATKSFEPETPETPVAPAEDTPAETEEAPEDTPEEDSVEPQDKAPAETPEPAKEAAPEKDEPMPELPAQTEAPAPKPAAEETSDLTPDQLANLPKPKAQDRDLATAAKAAQQAAEEFGEYNPNRTLDVDELPQLGPDDVVAATGAPQIDHAFIVQHKTKTQWWEWVIIGAMIVILALVALNFLLDAGVIKPGANLPHTHLINKS